MVWHSLAATQFVTDGDTLLSVDDGGDRERQRHIYRIDTTSMYQLQLISSFLVPPSLES